MIGVGMKVRAILLFAIVAAWAMGDPAVLTPEAIVENYCVASRGEAQMLQGGASMDVEIAASLPKLKKQGRLHALRHISALGRITYEMLKFDGDSTVKNQVIARYLSAEAEAQRDESPSLAVTPANYKFKYKRRGALDGREVHIFQVTPRKKGPGLFKGEVWIDAATSLRVQESGRLVKNPSIFLKRVDFVRKYEILNGVSAPLQVKSVVATRLAGTAELTIDYSNFSVPAPRQDATGEANLQ
jgi:hypothetical protein